MKNLIVETAFPGPSEWGQVSKGISKVVKSAKTGAFMDLTLRDFSKNALVAVEVGLLFFVGEIIGRGNLIGYNV